MRIIDEKGKLFGKINVIDFLVILFLLSIIPMFYFGYKILTKNPVEVVAPVKEFIETEISFRLIKLEPEVVNIISVGDKELNEGREVIGEIVNLGKIIPYTYRFDIGAGEKITREDPNLKQILARLKLKTEVKQNNLYYKDKPITINSPLDFKTDRYNIIAIPVKIKKTEKTEERVIDLYITLKDLNEDIAKLVSVGDREVDENGQIIAEILSLGKLENNSLDFDLGSGNFIRGEDSSKKQISVKMRLRCKVQDNNRLYFKGKNVKYNLPIEFKTDRYIVKGMIAKTYEMPVLLLKEKWISLQVKFSGVIPEIASIIQKGDAEKSVSKERVKARIRSIISNKPSEVLSLDRGKFITLNHPFHKDIVLSLDVLCVQKDGIYYFKNYPAKMGNSIVFATDLYSVSGTIIGLEIK